MSGKLTLKFSDEENPHQSDIETTVTFAEDGARPFFDALMGFMALVGFCGRTVDDAVLEIADEINDDRNDEQYVVTPAGSSFLDTPSAVDEADLSEPPPGMTENGRRLMADVLKNNGPSANPEQHERRAGLSEAFAAAFKKVLDAPAATEPTCRGYGAFDPAGPVPDNICLARPLTEEESAQMMNPGC